MALLGKFADMREEELSRLATQVVVLLVSVGIECYHGVDHPMVVHQVGFSFRQAREDIFKNGKFARSGEAVENNNLATGDLLDRLGYTRVEAGQGRGAVDCVKCSPKRLEPT